MTFTDDNGLPVGPPIPEWSPPGPPPHETLAGTYCRVEPLDVDAHAADLHAAFVADAAGIDWAYLPYGPFDGQPAFETWMRETCLGDDPLFFAIVDGATGRAAGMASYLNIVPRFGSVEVGHIHFAPSLQKSRVATEAMYLMMRHAFENGYRRYEWKCNALNARSRRAARRFGFSYEGVFRNHMVVRGHSRDSAWYACVESEWPALRAAFETWLDDGNFAAGGRQRRSLRELTGPVLVARDDLA